MTPLAFGGALSRSIAADRVLHEYVRQFRQCAAMGPIDLDDRHIMRRQLRVRIAAVRAARRVAWTALFAGVVVGRVVA